MLLLHSQGPSGVALKPLGWVFSPPHAPRRSCLISRLAWEVVNWFTMSSAVWLYVFRMFTSTPP